MPLILNKEDGSGLADANSYASVTDGDAYHEGHLYATAWTGATADKKAAALVMATRVIDAEYQFGGVKVSDGQALSWPRRDCPDPDTGEWVSETIVPPAAVAATCDLARELLIVDRTASPAGEGLKYENVGGTQKGYDKTDTRPVMPALVQAMLSRIGTLIKSRSGTVKLLRV